MFLSPVRRIWHCQLNKPLDSTIIPMLIPCYEVHYAETYCRCSSPPPASASRIHTATTLHSLGAWPLHQHHLSNIKFLSLIVIVIRWVALSPRPTLIIGYNESKAIISPSILLPTTADPVTSHSSGRKESTESEKPSCL